jgi:hypothetical protein
MELDLASPRFGEIIRDTPLPPDLVAHHIYNSPANTKAYITALGRPELRVMESAPPPASASATSSDHECRALPDERRCLVGGCAVKIRSA